MDKGVFQVVMKEDIPEDANILEGRFVLALKNVGTNREIYKARFVVQGHTDQEKNLLVHTVTNIRHRSIKMLVAIAAIFGFRLWTKDISQAYLQIASKLTREVFVKPNSGFELRSDQLLRLLNPLYGLSDSGDYWHVTMKKHLTNDLKMHLLTEDLANFVKCVHGTLSSMIGTYVDDIIGAGDDGFIK